MVSKEIFTHCNKCPNKVVTKLNNNSVSWYCGKTTDKYTCTKNKNIKYFVHDGDLVPSPSWCPLKSSGKYSAFTKASCEDDYKSKTTTYVSPYVERLKKLEKLHHMSDWDSIKVDEIYHVPPINGEPRMDIIITSKSQFSIGYKTITKNNKVLTTFNNFYPTSPQINFLVKHKLITIETAKK